MQPRLPATDGWRKEAAMVPIIFFSIFIVFASIGWLVGTYNRFIKYKNRIEESWSGIDVALKRRFNLIPNLIRAIEGYSEHEAKILMSNSRERSGSDSMSDRVEEESRISKSLRGILAVAEAYPDLKTSNNFMDLQNNLDEIEEDIQKARNRYNSSVNKFNTLVETVPATFIARKFGFKKQSYFTLDLVTQRELPEVDFSKPGGPGKQISPDQGISTAE